MLDKFCITVKKIKRYVFMDTEFHDFTIALHAVI